MSHRRFMTLLAHLPPECAFGDFLRDKTNRNAVSPHYEL